MRAVDVHDVEAGLARPLGRLDVEALHLTDVVSVHLLRVREVLEVARDLGGRAGRSVSMQGACGPPYQSSAAASAPCSWSMSHMSPRFLMSSSSQRRAETRCVSSDSGWIEQYSVQTAA